jgi:hypothetical protein
MDKSALEAVIPHMGPSRAARLPLGRAALQTVAVKDYIPLLVAVVAAMTALVGYLLNGAAGRRTERMRRYADALDAVERYQQLPYTFRRRHNETAEIRDELARMLADVQVTLSFHRRWLRMDAAELGEAYGALVDKIKLTNKALRTEALAAPPAGRDVEIEISPGHNYNQADERDECLRRMQKYLRLSRNIF